jgi:polyhydroxyalkanoate synthesis regulator phasin
MPQPKKGAAKPAAKNGAARAKARPVPLPATGDDVLATFAAVRERLVSSVTLTTDRLQETLDDAVRRGRMTRKDAEDLLATLMSAGRTQTEQLVADLEQLLTKGRDQGRAVSRSALSTDAVMRHVDRVRRQASGGPSGAKASKATTRPKGFPISGYERLSAAQVTRQLGDLSPTQLRRVRDRERRDGNRKTVLSAIEKKLG